MVVLRKNKYFSSPRQDRIASRNYVTELLFENLTEADLYVINNSLFITLKGVLNGSTLVFVVT